MKFDKLRLTGFKSFVEQTDVLIEPGLTGVVGPNGCGKSNLVEALRWVMGEASYKSVRGSSMDDVIFAGTGRRATRDTAEVTLFLDNKDRSAPAEMNHADELEVTRRISRGIGSDYRVNGKVVRARDVQLLFADAATGSRSPSMVRQGQVAELIAAKPTDRRNILEEAAGISGLRARKHEASLKLNAAEQNLSRVDDVSAEVDRQMETLKRQARQASRYRNVSAEIRTLEATVHHLRWIEARGAVRDGEAALEAARAAQKEAAERQARTATDEAAAQHALPPLREAEAAAAQKRQEIAAAIAALDAKDKQLAEKLAALKAQCASLEKDLARQDGAKADAASAVDRLTREEAELTRANDGADARIAELQTAAEAAQTAADAADRAASEATEKAATVLAARASAEAQLSRAVSEADKAANEVRRLTALLEEARRNDAMRRREAAAAALAEAETAETAAGDALGAAETALPALKEADATAREALQKIRTAISERETEAKALARLTATLAKSGDAILEACTVGEGYEQAFAAALGDDLQAPVSADAPRRWSVNAGTDLDLPAGAEPLSAHVSAPEALARRLAQVGVVSEADGPRLQPLLSAGQRLVTRAGALWRWDGYAMNAGAPSAAAERLAQKNRLAALEAELAELTPRREAADRDAETARSALKAATDKEAAARQALTAARRAAGEARNRLSAADSKAREAEAAETRLAASLDAARSHAETAATARAEAQTARDAASTGEAEAKERDRLREAAGAARRRANDTVNAAEAERRAVYGRSRRLERLAAELKDWQGRLTGADGHREELAGRLKTARAERDALADAPDETILERRRLNTAEADAAAKDKAAREARAAAEAAERAAVEAARKALENLSTTRENTGRAEERLNAARARIEEVEAALTETLDCAPQAAARLAGLEAGAPLPDRAASEQRLEKLKGERERLGGVNLCAEDELKEIEDRRGTMLAERDDLLAAIDKLRQGIKELNREARERLVASFDKVNSEFQRLFTHLFGGGEASLQLTEAEDPLDAGLDIIARPPGKKPQVLSLLSGGEQTLTATALIFAVFLTNPAPICVLDEIDAPLDDANVERFCALLEEMTRLTETRFLIITHNPITMARMHRLYGVTMVEKGVSQLVSVTLEAAEELRETA
ncbi:chromosome segregation protein SMC [Acuticoccus sp. M5D2P5]|uniref:chromosome segregation protein SMC n=1 Tax=Acuticoccus kalidii TaxID=2910977 RepID=UPI001F174AC0|nr:chromosome segregation protein SMC [Acuticoccus kalidii]MCF3936056.1 chromosome segregation protein SMC [Acuticoccus kalidii]